MKPINTVLVVLVTLLAVFAQAKFNSLRAIFGVQIDLLPSLVVYTSLSCGLPTLVAVVALGGLSFDSLSANPLGVTVLVLFIIGFAVQNYRGLILRESTYAQIVLGAGASAAAPFLAVIILLNSHTQPLIGWFSLWQWVAITAAGAIVTPLWFGVFDWLNRLFNYRPVPESGFRSDREIKRGRQ